ncbi:MAG: hypothetical protein J7K21_07455 [Desulfurococcales archaeon]|nr:hypothetical protein [Desulfurococcales archaeon]
MNIFRHRHQNHCIKVIASTLDCSILNNINKVREYIRYIKLCDQVLCISTVKGGIVVANELLPLLIKEISKREGVLIIANNAEEVLTVISSKDMENTVVITLDATSPPTPITQDL